MDLPVGTTKPNPSVLSSSHAWGVAGRASGSHLTSLLPMGEPGEQHEGQVLPGAKRPGSSGSSATESKRLRRLEKNRESARECRRRKKEHREELEVQLASLEEENLNLRLRLKVGDEAEDAENAEILEIKGRLDDMVSSGGAEGDILQTMDLLKDRFADYGSAHASAADFHLAQLSRLLLPTLTTRACMHAVLQTGAAGKRGRGTAGGVRIGGVLGSGDDVKPPPGLEGDTPRGAGLRDALEGKGRSLDARGGGGGGGGIGAAVPAAETEEYGSVGAVGGEAWVDMWGSLVDVLEATEEQQAAMRSQARAIADLARDLEGTKGIVERLKLLLADRNQTLDGEMAEIQRILTPTQTAKFVLWVSKNKACVHMLNQLWDKLHGGDAAASQGSR